MKNFIFSLVILISLLSGKGKAQNIRTPNGFKIRTGVNAALWLSQTERRGLERAQYMTEKDFELIASLGFDHIRLPVDEEQLWDEKGDKEIEAFNLLHSGIEWCIDNNMRVIVDMHVIRSHHFNSMSNTLWADQEEQDKLLKLWKQLADELKEYPNKWVAYELLNEAVADYHDDWNKLIQKIAETIRADEPKRTLVIGANQYQKAEYFPYLKVPENDQNIILSFHFYNPFLITHYGTYWNSLKYYSGPVHYPGEVISPLEQDEIEPEVKDKIMWAAGYWDKEVLEEKMMPAIEVANKLGLPLFCGEFGVFYKAPKEDALRWYSDITDLFRKHNIAFSHWAYKEEFLIVHDNLNPIYPLVNYLVK